MRIDIVIPVFNEQDSLALLVDEIETTANAHSFDPRIIFVDDGSNDESWKQIVKICQQKNRVSGIRLARNYGKSAALSAGFQQCEAEIVFTMDADLQDDPNEIPKFIEAIHEGADLVCGWKKIRNDGADRRFLSKGFNWMVNVSTGMKLHDHNCGFKAIKRERLSAFNMTRGMHRFVTVMGSASGGKTTEVVVNHRPRKFGKSKYGLGRVFRGFRDLLKVVGATRFGRRPVRVSESTNSFEVSETSGMVPVAEAENILNNN